MDKHYEQQIKTANMETIEAEGKKKIEDFIHLYIGCKCRITFGSVETLVNTVLEVWMLQAKWFKITPILRPLSSMTEEEKDEFAKHMIWIEPVADEFINSYAVHPINFEIAAQATKYLLSKGFDLFNLIPEGLALQSPQTTLPK